MNTVTLQYNFKHFISKIYQKVFVARMSLFSTRYSINFKYALSNSKLFG